MLRGLGLFTFPLKQPTRPNFAPFSCSSLFLNCPLASGHVPPPPLNFQRKSKHTGCLDSPSPLWVPSNACAILPCTRLFVGSQGNCVKMWSWALKSDWSVLHSNSWNVSCVTVGKLDRVSLYSKCFHSFPLQCGG